MTHTRICWPLMRFLSGSCYPWFIVALLWVVALLNYLDRQVIFSVFPLLRADLKLSDVEIGLVGGAFLWVYGVFSPFGGYLADRFGARLIIVLGLFTWSVVTWATGQCRTFAELLLARGAMGLSEACYLPAGLALIASVHGERTRSLATGLHFSGLYVGIILGGFGGGWLGEHYGWRFSFGILGSIGIAYCLFLAYALYQTAPARPARPPVLAPGFLPALAELVKLPGFITLTGVFAGMAVANWLVYTWLPLYLYEHFHMGMAEAGFVATFYNQAGCMVGMLAGGWIADRWSQTNSRARVFTQAISLAFASPALLLAGITDSRLLLICSLTVFGIARAAYDCTAMPLLCQIARPELRSTGYGIFTGIGCIAGGIMATGAGWIKANLGLTAAFYLAAAILLSAAISVLWVPVARSALDRRRPPMSVATESV